MAARAAASLKIYFVFVDLFRIGSGSSCYRRGKKVMSGSAHLGPASARTTPQVCVCDITAQKTERRAKDETKSSSLLLTSFGKSLIKGAYKNLTY